MTELLKDVLEQKAYTVDPPAFDVGEIVREGGRRRRRRSAAVGSLAIAAVVAGLAVPAALGTDWLTDRTERPSSTTPVASGFAAGVPAYAVGTTLHLGDQRLDLPVAPKAMVQTQTGVVFVDDAGQVWATTENDPIVVGDTNRRNPRLIADGDRVAWLEGGPKRPHVTVMEHSNTGGVSTALTTRRSTSPSNYGNSAVTVYALDGDVVYVGDARGAVAWNYVTDNQTVLLADAEGMAIDDVEDGLIAYSPQGANLEESRYRVGPDLRSGYELDAWNGFALSPGATYLLGEDNPDMATIFEVATGAKIPAIPTGYDFFGGYTWIDEDTYLGIGLTDPWETSGVDLVRCDVGGACELVAEELPSFDDGLVLPTGEVLD